MIYPYKNFFFDYVYECSGNAKNIKLGFNFIKKSWISNVYKVNNKIIVKYKNNCIKGKIVDLLINGGIKLKIRKETKEIFYGDQIT